MNTFPKKGTCWYRMGEHLKVLSDPYLGGDGETPIIEVITVLADIESEEFRIEWDLFTLKQWEEYSEDYHDPELFHEEPVIWFNKEVTDAINLLVAIGDNTYKPLAEQKDA